MGKTELEKRWEDEEETVDAAEEEDNAEYQFIMSPMTTSEEELPLAFVMVNNRLFFGGIARIDEDGIVMHMPLAYVEMPDQQNPGRLQIGMQKVIHSISIPESMWFRHDALNIIKSNEPKSMEIARVYENTVKEIKLSESGLSVPSNEDMKAYVK